MYIPKYRITTAILKNIGWVEAAKEVIENAPIVPAWEAKFQNEAKLKAAHFGTALEGNDLSLSDAKILLEQGVNTPQEAVAAGVVGRERDVQEVMNYRKVLDYLDSLKGTENFSYTKELILEIHKLVTQRLMPDDRSGQYRQVQVVLKNSLTGEVGFRPPAFLEVPFLIDDFLRWLNSEFGRSEHPVIRAGVTHYVLAAVHPFVEGNGRTARAFAMLVLLMEGYDIKSFFALEEYFDSHAEDYFGSLMAVSNQTSRLEDRDLTPWLETFTQSLAIELTRIKDIVRQLSIDSQIRQRQGKQVTLSQRQLKLMEYLNAHGEMTMAEARGQLLMVSEDTILRDLKDLMNKGVIAKKGSTKAARYVVKK